MERMKVDSSQIVSAGWERDQSFDEIGTFEIEFNSGAVYQYKNVPMETSVAFWDSESKGRFFAQNIKAFPEKYPFVCVSDTALQRAKVDDKSTEAAV